jgi:Domain of Unknown Function (DUF1080)
MKIDFYGMCRNVSRVKIAVKILAAAFLVIAFFALAGCKTASPQQNTRSITSSVELFNGKNFDGWTFCMKNNADPAKTWSIHDGVIHCTGQPYGYARTKQSFQNYKLTCIWRFVKVAPHADNSGIFVHIQPPDKVWPPCIECQGEFQHQGDLILHAGVGADGHPASSKSVFIPQMGPPNENRAGEWNTNEVICQDSTISPFVNGKTMNMITDCTLTSGFIGIQSEGGDIEVRKLSLQPVE